MSDAEVLIPLGLGLGEGATALDDTRFLFVDIHEGLILSGNLDGHSTVLASFDHTIGAVAATADGDVLWAGGTSIGTLEGGETISLDTPPTNLRMNDGKGDPCGRFVGGTMCEPVRNGAGGLWSFENGRALLIVDDVTISNGLCWSDDGETMFYIDTPTQRIDAFDYDLETGTVSDRRTIVEIAGAVGSPDGMTIDHEGGLWVALWGGSVVHRYVDGRLDHVIDVPTAFVTSVTFAGSHLVITTAAEPMNSDASAGHVFVADVRVGGPLPHVVDTAMVFSR